MGAIKEGKNRNTGNLVQLWRLDDHEFKSVIGSDLTFDADAKYVLLCVEHNGSCGFAGQRSARDLFSKTSEWCKVCAGEDVAPKVIKPKSVKAKPVVEDIEEPVAIEELCDMPDDATTRRLTETALLKKGDTVKVKGQQGTYTVMWIDQFRDVKRLSEVTVVGGTAGHSAFRTFTIDKIKSQSKRRKTA